MIPIIYTTHYILNPLRPWSGLSTCISSGALGNKHFIGTNEAKSRPSCSREGRPRQLPSGAPFPAYGATFSLRPSLPCCVLVHPRGSHPCFLPLTKTAVANPKFGDVCKIYIHKSSCLFRWDMVICTLILRIPNLYDGKLQPFERWYIASWPQLLY